MRISLSDRIDMYLEGVPVRMLVRCIKKAEEEGIFLDHNDMEDFHLCGGHLEDVVDGLIFAKRNGINADFLSICDLDFADIDINQTLKQCIHTRTVKFETYTPDGSEPVQDCCTDGQAVRAMLEMDFKLNLQLADPQEAREALEYTQERLATRTAVYIHTAASADKLMSNRKTHQSELLSLAKKKITTAEAIRITYTLI